MDAATRERVFEPFFSTDGSPVGTASLGLASVYGIVKQSGGEISVESEPGRGTTFVVHLPAVAAKGGEGRAAQAPEPENGNATILLVEDQEMVREMTRAVLDQEGYRVLVATDGREAVRVSQDFAAAIDLVITDMVMPGLSGRETAEQLRATRPGTRVIFVSGYTADVLGEPDALGPGTRFLQKPFRPDQLTAAVRDALRER